MVTSGQWGGGSWGLGGGGGGSCGAGGVGGGVSFENKCDDVDCTGFRNGKLFSNKQEESE